jgi:hypothetical protein
MEKHFGKVGGIIGLTTFLLLLISVQYVLGNPLVFKNIIAFAIFGFIIGAICTALLFYKFKIAFRIFILGIFIGFFELFRAFLTEMNGWSDLIGIVSLFMATAFGLALGLTMQLIVYFIRRNK